MNRNLLALRLLTLALRLLAAFLFVVACASRSVAEPPNLLLIVADDMGYGDLGCTGSATIKTPHLDALAQSGVLCTRAYVASSVCSPSRAGLMTGRDPRRFGYEGNLNERAENYPTRPELLGLPPNEWTLGDHLRAAGYSTALVGKWHLGDSQGFHPNVRGFDHFCGMLGGGHTYFPRPGKNRIERNGAFVESFSSAYLTDFFTDEALRWIGSAEKASRDPWLMVLSYNAPHTPMEATEEDLDQVKEVTDPKRRTYAAMMRALDRGVGRVMCRLDELGVRDNTIVVFLSDNGGATNNASWNGPLSGAKGTLREGGVRVPMIWSWPARIPAGVRCDSLVSSLDILTTFMSAAEQQPLALNEPLPHADKRNARVMKGLAGAYDGRDALPLLTGAESYQPPARYWRLQGQAAVMRGDMKLIRLSHRPAQLFNVAEDPSESADLSSAESDTLEALYRDLGKWESSLPTVPLWDSSPFWWGDSARIYDSWSPRAEPR